MQIFVSLVRVAVCSPSGCAESPHVYFIPMNLADFRPETIVAASISRVMLDITMLSSHLKMLNIMVGLVNKYKRV